MMHKRLSLLTRLCLLVYLFTPNVPLHCTTTKIGGCKWRRGLSGGRRQLEMQKQGLGSIHGGTGHGPPLLPGLGLPSGDQPMTSWLLFVVPMVFSLWRTWDTSPHPPLTAPAGFPSQPGLKCHLALALPAPTRCHPQPPFPDGCTQPAVLLSPSHAV